MGTHPSGEAVVVASSGDEFNGLKLSQILTDIPEYSGNIDITKRFGSDLPFLFKILSVQEPLSIQSHPDKKLAEEIHARDPSNYPDDNHKPEMAIALTNFEVLCSFRPNSQIEHFMTQVVEFRRVIGESLVRQYLDANADQKRNALKNCFSSLISADRESVRIQLKSLSDRLEPSELDVSLQNAFRKLYAVYPEDSGCFCLFFMNHIELKPGEGIFLAANEPHCYISGGKLIEQLIIMMTI